MYKQLLLRYVQCDAPKPKGHVKLELPFKTERYPHVQTDTLYAS